MKQLSRDKALTILLRFGQELRAILDLPTLLDKILTILGEVQNWHNCAIFLKDDAGNIAMKAASGYLVKQDGAKITPDQDIINQAAQHNRVWLIPDATAEPSYSKSDSPKSGSRLAVPLATEDRVIGVLLIEGEKSNAFTRDDAPLLEAIRPSIATAIEAAQLLEQTRSAAFHDELTGVYNYRYFNEQLKIELAKSKRYSLPLSIAIIDVDGLKQINDTLGHLAGDEALRIIGRVLKENLRLSDVAARYGGDEFAIILPQTTKEQARKVLIRIMSLLDKQVVPLVNQSIPLPHRSYGTATYPEDGDNPVELFTVADKSLYQNKRAPLISN